LRRTAIAFLLIAAGCSDRSIDVTEAPVVVMHETIGMGNPVRTGDLVEVNYTISTMDGRVIQRHERYRFQAGLGYVVTAMDEAIIGMREGGRRRIEAAPQKHWGRAGYGDGEGAIPPATRLIFDVELIAVE